MKNGPSAAAALSHRHAQDRTHSAPGVPVDRADLAAVFSGEGPVPVLWATDCPVRFDVWLAFARPSASGGARAGPEPWLGWEAGRQDLILPIREEYGVERVLERFQSRGLMETCRPIASGSFVAARLTLKELVSDLLPLTSLAGVVRVAHELARADRAGASRQPSPDTSGRRPPARSTTAWSVARSAAAISPGS